MAAGTRTTAAKDLAGRAPRAAHPPGPSPPCSSSLRPFLRLRMTGQVSSATHAVQGRERAALIWTGLGFSPPPRMNVGFPEGSASPEVAGQEVPHLLPRVLRQLRVDAVEAMAAGCVLVDLVLELLSRGLERGDHVLDLEDVHVLVVRRRVDEQRDAQLVRVHDRGA